MEKFMDVNIIDALRAIMETNTIYYKTDFNYDIDSFRKVARRKEPEEKNLLWLSRTSGTHVYSEHQVFQKDTAEYNGWLYYINEPRDRILPYLVEVKDIDMKTGIVTGNLYALDYKTHAENLRDSAVPHTYMTLFYNYGKIETADKKNFNHYNYDMKSIYRARHEPDDPAALAAVLLREKATRDSLFTEGNINRHIGALQDARIKYVADRVVSELDKTAAPNSPDKKDFMVYLSTYFSNTIPEADIRKIIKALPYKSAKICYIGDKEGFYAVFDKQEVLRRRKPSILNEVKNATASIKQTERKNPSLKNELLEV